MICVLRHCNHVIIIKHGMVSEVVDLKEGRTWGEGGPWHDSRTEKMTNHRSRIRECHFDESQK